MATFAMPKVAEATDEYVVVSLEVAVGDNVSLGEVLMVVETDKVDADVESTFAGVVSAFLVAEGAEIRTGDAIVEYDGVDGVEQS